MKPTSIIWSNARIHKTLILLFMSTFFSCNTTKKIFNHDLAQNFANPPENIRIMQHEDISDLPTPLQKYLANCGFVGREIPVNAEWVWKDSRIMMKPGSKWMKLKTLQYNSVEKPFRIAYMKAHIAGIIPFEGRDIYSDGYGNMKGKVLKGITVINAEDSLTAQSAGIVLLAEALMVPGYIFCDYIKWEAVDDFTVKGILDNNGIKVEAMFYFNEKGEYTHFYTLDRNFAHEDGTYSKIPYSVYIDSYREINGFKIPTNVRAVWHLDSGDYEYWVGNIGDLKFNVRL